MEESGIIGQEFEIDAFALKINYENAEAMIDGFENLEKYGKKIKTSILAIHKLSNTLKGSWKFDGGWGSSEYKPKLITLIKNSNFKRSDVGEKLHSANNPDYYYSNFQNKYITFFKKRYKIENNEKIWRLLCNDGTFDIWHFSAPFDLLQGKKEPSKDPSILLLRVYEIENVVTKNNISNVQYVDVVHGEKNVKILKPMITDDEYFKIKNNLENNYGLK